MAPRAVIGTAGLGGSLSIRQPLSRSCVPHALTQCRPLHRRSFRSTTSPIGSLGARPSAQVCPDKRFDCSRASFDEGLILSVTGPSCCSSHAACLSFTKAAQQSPGRTSRLRLPEQLMLPGYSLERRSFWESHSSLGPRFCLSDSCSSVSCSTTPFYVIQR